MGRTSDARQRLIRSATKLFLLNGYHAVGVQEICADAGVNKGSFYHFFPSKRDLVLAVIDEHEAGFRAMARAAMEGDRAPLEKVTAFFDGTAGAVPCRDGMVCGCPIGNLSLELSTHDEIVRARLEEVTEGMVETLAALLEEARNAGELSEDINPESAARALVAYSEGTQMMAKVANDRAVADRLRPHALRLIGLPATAG